MSNGFNNMIFTQQGLNLLAKAQTGTQLQFTRIAAGDGILNGQDASKFTRLINEVLSLNISELVTNGTGAATIGTIIDNANLDEGFYWREIGIFASDPQLGEILYGYDNAIGGEIFIPDKNSGTFTANLNVGVYISNAANVTAIIDSSLVYATKEDINKLLDGTTPAGDAEKLGGTAANQYVVKTTLAAVATSGNYNDLSNKPSLKTVATSGSYKDLIDKPTFFTWGNLKGA